MTLQVGQEVRMYAQGRRNEEEMWGTITKVGRKLVTIRYGYGYEKQFRIDSGHINDDYGHTWFKTDEQTALDDRRKAALAALHEAGLQVHSGARLSLETLEAVAAVVSA